MLEEHRDEKEKIEKIRVSIDDPDTVVDAGRYIINLLRNHIMKEDQVLFPLAEHTLGEEEKASIREGMDAVGSFA